MSVMERRLQLLLDQARYDRVEAEARASGRSVAAVIREAIDSRFPVGHDQRAAAMERFLAMTVEGEHAESAEDVIAALHDESAERARL
ncbi:MAG: hypothetical protein CMH83_09335 [Nocardioides sp.]|nr:hypothetical protein [Nocardioides sp.]